MKDAVEVGYQAFVSDGGEEFGAVRQVLPGELVVYVENAGDLVFPMAAVEKVHFGKVVFTMATLMFSDGEQVQAEKNVLGLFVVAFGITQERAAAIKAALHLGSSAVSAKPETTGN